ncbi:MAG TPA: response regulator, partial [Chthoniobacterales bacterium]|nr:response regulator [Chthoniobacterales bacterium]
MPPSIPKPTGTASRPAILLVEDYDALAVAIGLALKKFAPDHTAQIARTLEAAEVAADEIRPELIIVDFDPPHPRIVEVFERLRSAHAEARVLVIAAGVPPDFIVQRKSGGALQFIDKPFDLSAFGAAVQALLGPWTPQSRNDSRGTLGDLGLADVIPLECLADANLVLRLQSHDKQDGEVHLFGGQITHAATTGARGTEALREMLGWRRPQFKIVERPADASR